MPDVAPLAAELRFALNRMNRRLRQQATGDDLTVSQLSVLAILNREGAVTAGELAAKEHVRPPSMTRVIAALEASGLIARGENPDDGRQVLVSLTAAGQDRVLREIAARERWLAQQLQALSLDDRALLRQAAAILNNLAGG